EAMELFKQAAPLLPPPYDVKKGPCENMIERCEALVGASPEKRMEVLELDTPDAEWDGVWRLHSK
ncbi:MAG: hypothetical protein L6Q71_01835, partial [Planctomycetes bacterium]|nr:hypothetical protein [Planctomycetota bacterium]